ncbi:MAG TPA: BON domain-containing protein, partial [Rhodanobacteraceae bacterium]|nr:BON domain-containing protein [Rhodanobacteraceae bacterium]
MNAPDPMRTAALGIALLFAAPPLTASAQETGDVESAQPITDTWITAKVKTELATTQGAKSLALDVRTVDGAVRLSGVLAS